MAKRRLLPARALQRRLREINVEHQGKNPCPTREDRSILPVSGDSVLPGLYSVADQRQTKTAVPKTPSMKLRT